MSTTTVRTPVEPISLYRPLWTQRWGLFVEAWQAWRAQARQRAAERAAVREAVRALAGLDPRLLKDVGLGEFASAPGLGTQVWQLVERARW